MNVSMCGGHRVLPPWMEKTEEKEKEPRKKQRVVFYCMNEKELVEAAVSLLGSFENAAALTDQKDEAEAQDTTAKTKEKPVSAATKTKPETEALEEEASDCSDAQESTYVSEADLDITEVETLPYTGCLQHKGPQPERSEPVQDQSRLMNMELEAEKVKECSQMPTTAVGDDNALRLVREIFFTR